MNRYLKPANLPLTVLAAGILGLLLRLWLHASANGNTGLLAANHPASFLLWVLTAAVVAAIVWATRDLKHGTRYRFNFPPFLPGAVGCLLGALSIGVSAVSEWIQYPDTLTVIASLLGILATAALLFLADARRKGNHPNFLYHGVVCLYFMFRLVSQYRHWSADPQLMNYCFPLLASVCLMLSSYQNAAFDAKQGNRRMHTIFHLGAVYFSFLSLLGGDNLLFYLGTGVWMVTNLCNLSPLRRREAE